MPQREDITACLEVDATNLGAVWRETQRVGDDLAKIAAVVSPVQPTSYFRKYLAFLALLVDADASGIAGHEREAATQLLRFVNRHRVALSDQAIDTLRLRAEAILQQLGTPEALGEARARLARLERGAVPGIYVYALPHYLLHPVQPSSDDVEADRTLMKVGMSDRDTLRRFREQQRSTELPEDPELLRVYCGDHVTYADVERRFHDLLRGADHRQARGVATGTEWFLTSIRFLDTIAAALGLRQHDLESPAG